MILQALDAYYTRKSDLLPPLGFERKEIPFIIEIDAAGKCIQIEDTREGEGKKKHTRAFIVPQGIKKTSAVAANLLWDNAEYAINTLNSTKLKAMPKLKRKKYIQRLRDQHQAFTDKVRSLGEQTNDDALKALLCFFDTIKQNKRIMSAFLCWEELQLTAPNVSFRLQGKLNLICQSSNVIEAIREAPTTSIPNNNKSPCLVRGTMGEVERLHSSIKGVWGAQSSGANIVSFNLSAFHSFGKKQGSNAPVSKEAVFAYTTALNHLLRQGSPQRMQVGDTSTVFWAEKKTDFEKNVVNFFSEPTKDDPDRNVRAVTQLFKAVEHGRYTKSDAKNCFYVLGLAPNAARISVRFWHVLTVGALAERVVQHFKDIEIIHAPREIKFLTLFRLLLSIASLGKTENIPPNLAGETMRAILDGSAYPQTLLGAAVRRIKAEQYVSYPRVALIKGCINRYARIKNHKKKKEFQVSLDQKNTNIGYRLGRLFAVLEKVQEEANPGLNATIRDRYYGSASSSPVTAFSTLLKLKNHHIPKLPKGRAVNMERLIGEIMEDVQDFPAYLSIDDQGRFAIGYYHQRQNFFKKPEEKDMNNA